VSLGFTEVAERGVGRLNDARTIERGFAVSNQ